MTFSEISASIRCSRIFNDVQILANYLRTPIAMRTTSREWPWLPDTITVVQQPIDAELDVLTPAERALVANAVPRRRTQFAAGRACAHAVLAQLGKPARELLRLETGAPQWPLGIVGSIAHCDAAAVASCADAGRWHGLGADVEIDAPFADDIAEYVLTDDERGHYARLPGGVAYWGLLAFSAKECVHKCLHPLRSAFLEFGEVAIDVDPNTLRFEPRPLSAAAAAAFAGLHFDGRWRRDNGCLFAVLGAV
jgi:4'-phosphopantetheinyl transferase EntD